MRRALAIALNQGATLVIGLAGVVLISHVIPKGVYGEYSLFLTLTQLGLLLTHSGVINHASRYWQRERPQAGAYVHFLLGTTWQRAGTLALLLLAVSLGMAWSRGPLWLGLWPLLVLSNLAVALFNLANLALNAGERHWAVLALNGLGTAARTFLPVGLALILGATVLNLSVGFTLHGLVVAGTAWVCFRNICVSQSPGGDVVAKWQTELREFGRPFVLMGVGSWLMQYADRWIVAFFFGKELAGLFNLATNVASIVPTLVAATLMQRVFPVIFRQADAAQSEADWRRLAGRCDLATFAFLGLSLAGLVALHLIGPYLVGWVIRGNYAPSMDILLPAGMVAVGLQANQFQYLLLQGQHNSAGMVRIMLVLSAIRTIGSLAAGLISWFAFLAWLILSTVLLAGLGRALIRRMAFKRLDSHQDPTVLTSLRG